MDNCDYIFKVNEVLKAMQDEESVVLYKAKLNFLLNQNLDLFLDEVNRFQKKWICEELNEFLEKIFYKGILIFGAGHDGQKLKKLLDHCNHPASYFCDSNSQMHSRSVEGLPVISIEQLNEEFRDYVVILASSIYLDEMYRKLVISGFPRKNILSPMYKCLVAINGNQYFDVFNPVADEIFVDAGAYTGDTIKAFINWTGRCTYKKIYAFEPFPENNKKLKALEIEKLTLIEKVTWSKETQLFFEEAGAGSKVDLNGNKAVNAIRIDDAVGNDKVTFIKMDVEGSEMNSLIGARNTIQKNKPRLAICIYHKPQDVLEIPGYILSLVPEYKFYIRHYASNLWETVLYAIVE